MEFWQVLVLALVEGITEFLPVSSTGHLIVVSKWLEVDDVELNASFSIIIQLAAILAVLVHYKDTIRVRHMALWIKVAISFLPLGCVGFVFADEIKQLFDVTVVATMFIVGGVVFLLLERWYDDTHERVTDITQVSYKQAIWIGIAQVFSLVPGTSRAGATIVGGMLTKLDRKASAEYSFLLALPVMTAVSGYEFIKHYASFSMDDIGLLAVGFVMSFIVAYYTMSFFMSFLTRFTFVTFGIYRIIFGFLLLCL